MKTFNIYSTLLAVLALFASTMTATAETITAIKNGHWFAPDTWDLGRVPGENDDVVIAEGFSVDGKKADGANAGADFKVASLVVNGTLTQNSSKKLTIIGAVTITTNGSVVVVNDFVPATIDNYGKLEVQGTTTASQYIYNHEGAEINFTASGKTLKASANRTDAVVNEGRVTNADGKVNYIYVASPSCLKAEQLVEFRDNGGFVYITTVDYSHYAGKTFHLGAGSEFAAEYNTSMSWNTPYVWPENYIDKNVLYDYYPGKAVHQYVDDVIIPSGKTCTYNANVNNVGTFTIESGAIWNANDNRTLFLNGQFINNGTIRVNDNKTLTIYGEGSVVNNYGSIENNSVNKGGAKISIVSGIEFKDHDISKGEGSYVYGEENENRKITVSVLAPVTYYWKGTSGSNWSTVDNWFFDPEFKTKTNAAPNSATIRVVIPEGQTCNMENDKSVASLTINGTLTNAAKTLTSYGDVVVNGTIDAANKIAFTVHGNFIANSTASVNFKNGADFKVLGNATVNTDITTSNDIKFYMADNTNVNLNKKITFTAAKSITVGSYANINLDGNNIKVNLGDDCSFVSNNINSNLYVFPDMIDWKSENVYKHFTYTKGGQKMRLYLRARPEGEQTFYWYPFQDNPLSGGNWKDDRWTLVNGYCVYVYYPGKNTDSKESIQQYYPGFKNDAFSGFIDHAVIPVGVNAVTLDRSIRCLGSLTVDGILKINNGLDPLCAGLVTINSIQSLAIDIYNFTDDTYVIVKKRPDNEVDFYATKDGTWTDNEMWSLREGKKWFVVDGEGKTYTPSTTKDYVIIPSGIDVSLNDNYEIGDLTVNGGLDLASENVDMQLSVGFLLGEGDITMKHLSNLYIRNNDDKWDGDLVTEAEEAGTMFYACKSGKWDDPTTWTTDPALRPVKLSTYPGKDSKGDMVTISAGKSVTTTLAECKIASLCLKGELQVSNKNSILIITGDVTGEGTLDVYDINKNFQVYRKKLNTFYPKGTVVIRESCELPANEFGNLDVYAKDVRICGDIRINNNLTIRKNGELIMGRDLYELTIDGVTYGNWDDVKDPDGTPSNPLRTVFKAMAAAGRKSPEAMNIFFNAFVGGDVLLEENATLKASHIDALLKRARSSEGGIGWPTWSWINFQGDVVLQKGAEINFYDPYKFNYSKYPNARITPITMGNVDRLVNMVFSGSKNAKFEIADGAHVYTSQIVCHKDENAEIYINPETSECLYSLARAGRPDEDYWIYAYHIRSGIMHLGPNVVIKAWGSTRTRNGEPTLRNRTYDIMHLESDIPLKHGTYSNDNDNGNGNSNKFEDKFSSLLLKDLNDNLKKYPTAYTFVRRERTLASELDEAFFFDQTRASGLFIPENGQLWIDGAYVDLGVADEYGSGLLDYVYDNTKDPATNGNDKAFFYGFVDLRGKLRVSNGGKLIMPHHSVGIFYDSPNVDRCSTAAEIIMEGESSEIHTSRIYGMHDRQLNFKMTGGTLYFDRKTPISASSFKFKNNKNSANQTYLIDPKNTDAIRQRGGVANADGSYREEGCIFYMANGGTFNMSGGRIFFRNIEEGATTPHAINTLNLRNCSGLVSGGTIIYDQAEQSNKLAFTNYVPENIKLNNLTVTNSRKVEFWGTPTLSSDKGFVGHSLYVNGTLCLGYNPVWVPASEDGDDEEALVGHFDYSSATKTNSWLGTPENLYVAGDLYFGSTDGNNKSTSDDHVLRSGYYPMTYGVNFAFTDATTRTFPNVVFNGAKNQSVNTLIFSPFFNNLSLSKSDSKATVTLYGNDVYVFGDVEINRGVIRPGDSQTNAFVTMRNGQKVQNVVQGGTDGDMSALTLHFKNYNQDYDYNGDKNVNFKTDAVVGCVSVDGSNRLTRNFILGEHNLKLINGMDIKGETSGEWYNDIWNGLTGKEKISTAFFGYPFVCTSNLANGGITIPVSGSGKDDAATIAMATQKNNGSILRTFIRITPKSAVNGYMTIVPCNEIHPSLLDMDKPSENAIDYYWHMKWDGQAADPAFKYEFTLPSGISEGKIKNQYEYCLNNSSTYNWNEYGKSTSEIVTGYEKNWFGLTVSVKTKSYTFDNISKNSGDFTMGKNFDKNSGQILYSVGSGDWETKTNWSKSPTGTPVANKVPGLKDIAVVQAGHVVTVNNTNQKAGFITLNGTLVVKPSATNFSVQQFTESEDKVTYTADGEHTLIYEANGTSASIISGSHANLCADPAATVAYVNTGSTEYVVPSVNVIKSYPSLQLVGKVKISEATVGDNQFLTVASDLCAGPKEGSVVATLYGSTASTVNITPATDAYVEVKGQTITAATGTLNVNKGALNTYGTLINNGTFKISADASVNVYGDIDQANVTTKKFNVYGKLCFVDNVDQLVDGYEIHFYDGSTLVVDKTESDNKVYFNAYVKTDGSSKLNTDFQKGYLSLQPVNGKNDIKFGDEGGEFLTIPETFTLVASNSSGKGCTLTFQTYLHLDGKLIINDGATVNAYYGIGYSSTGESVLEVNNKATLYASQIAPWSTSGVINFKQETGATVDLGNLTKSMYSNPAYGVLDIRDGSFRMNNSAQLKIRCNSTDSSKPAIYYTPSNSELNTTSIIGIYYTTAEDETFDIYALKPLAALTIGSGTTYTSTVRMLSALTLNGNLSIAAPCTFDANGKDVIFYGNASVSGDYISNGNSTYISSANNQTLAFSKPTSFARFYKDGEGEAKFTNSNAETCVTDAFEVTNGSLNVATNILRILCEEPFVENGTSVIGKGISLCNPDKAQKIKAEGDISVLDINNARGVELSDQPKPLSITGSLRFTQGVLKIGSTGAIQLGESATIANGDASIPFGLNKMIDINLSSGDGSVTKLVKAKGTIILPIGSVLYKKYAPITVNMSAFGKANSEQEASFKVIPVNAIYPGMNSDVYTDHVMNFYWDITTTNINSATTKTTITCEGDFADAKGYDHNHDASECGEYIAAWLPNGSLNWSKKQSDSGKATVKVDGDRITLTYTLTTKPNDFAGVYLAGCANVLPDQGDSYINNATGNWDDAIWQKYDAMTNSVIDEKTVLLPENTAVYIRENTTVTMAEDYQTCLMVTIGEGAILDVAKSSSHNFGKIAGTGTLRIESGDLPGADWGTSAFNKAGGGTVFYDGNSKKEYAVMSESLMWNNVEFGGNNIWRLREDNVELQVNGDFIVNGVGTTFKVQLADNRVVRLIKDLVLNKGVVTGSGFLQFNRQFTEANREVGDTLQHIIFHNNVSVSGIEINNNGYVILDYTPGDGVDPSKNNILNVTQKLTLTNGIIYVPDEAKLRVANYDVNSVYRSVNAKSSTAYVDGWLYRYITSNNSQKYLFPVGNLGRYGYAMLEGYNASGSVMNGASGVRFVNKLATDYDGSEGTAASASNLIMQTLGNEYWLVDKGTSAPLFPYLSWDEQSLYNGTMSDVRVCYYNSYSNGKAGKWQTGILADSPIGDNSNGYLRVTNSSCSSIRGGKYAYALAGSALTSFSWTGKISDQWETEGNWAGGVAPITSSSITIGDFKGGIKNYPVIRNTDPVVGKSQVKNITIKNDAKLTIDGGALYVSGKVLVEDNDLTHDHIILNQRYDNTSNLRVVDGIKTKDENDVEVDYAGVVVNRIFETYRTFYVGSATMEGTFEPGYDSENNIGFCNLNSGVDLLKQYNPHNEKYTKYSSFAGVANYNEALEALKVATSDRTLYGGGTIGLRAPNNEDERTVVQRGTIWPANKEIKWSSLSMVDGADYGWNMFSNPYSYSIILQSSAKGKNDGTIGLSGDVNPVLWFRNYSSEENRYYNTVYNMKAGVTVNDYTSWKFEGQPLDNGVTIAPNQGFFVRSSSAGSSVTLRYSKTPVTTVSGDHLKALTYRDDVLRLVVGSDEANRDETALVFMDEGSRQVELFDAKKILEASDYNQIYVLKQNSRMSIPVFPEVLNMVDNIIPIGVQVSSKSSVATINARNIKYFDNSVDVYLYDAEYDLMVNMRNQPTYSFAANAGQKIDNRFAILLKSLDVEHGSDDFDNNDEDDVPTGINTQTTDGQIYVFKNTDDKAVVVVSDDIVASGAIANVYDMLGRLVNTVEIISNRTIVELGEQKGMYVVEVKSDIQSKMTKMLK